jgi:hypothetical protein
MTGAVVASENLQRGRFLTDLTKINVEIDFKVDTVDLALFVVSGGIGFLAKKFYEHTVAKPPKRRELGSRLN